MTEHARPVSNVPAESLDEGQAQEDLEMVEHCIKVERKQLEFLLTSPEFISDDGVHVLKRIAERHGAYSIGPDPKLKIGAKSKKNPTLRILAHSERPVNIDAIVDDLESLMDMKKKNRVTLKVDLPKDQHFYAIGKKGENIKELMNETGCHIHFPDAMRGKNASSKGGQTQPSSRDQVSITGPVEQAEVARNKLRGLLPLTISFSIPPEVPQERITMSEEVTCLAKEYGVTIFFKQRHPQPLALVKGPRKNASTIESVTFKLLNLLLGSSKTMEVYTLQFDIPSTLHGPIIGTNGSNIQKLMGISATNIRFPDAAKTSLVFVSGDISKTKEIYTFFQGLIPLLVSFEVSDAMLSTASQRLHLLNPRLTLESYMTQIGLQKQVAVTTHKKEQKGTTVYIKTLESNASAAYEVRAAILDLMGEHDSGMEGMIQNDAFFNIPQDDPVFIRGSDGTGAWLRDRLKRLHNEMDQALSLNPVFSNSSQIINRHVSQVEGSIPTGPTNLTGGPPSASTSAHTMIVPPGFGTVAVNAQGQPLLMAAGPNMYTQQISMDSFQPHGMNMRVANMQMLTSTTDIGRLEPHAYTTYAPYSTTVEGDVTPALGPPVFPGNAAVLSDLTDQASTQRKGPPSPISPQRPQRQDPPSPISPRKVRTPTGGQSPTRISKSSAAALFSDLQGSESGSSSLSGSQHLQGLSSAIDADELRNQLGSSTDVVDSKSDGSQNEGNISSLGSSPTRLKAASLTASLDLRSDETSPESAFSGLGLAEANREQLEEGNKAKQAIDNANLKGVRVPTSYWSGRYLSQSMTANNLWKEKEKYIASMDIMDEGTAEPNDASSLNLKFIYGTEDDQSNPKRNRGRIASDLSWAGSMISDDGSDHDNSTVCSDDRSSSVEPNASPPRSVTNASTKSKNNGLASKTAKHAAADHAEYWNVSSVSQLLEKLNLTAYISLLQEQEIDLPTLLMLDSKDLEEIGVKTFGARKKLSLAIEDLKKMRNADTSFLANVQDFTATTSTEGSNKLASKEVQSPEQTPKAPEHADGLNSLPRSKSPGSRYDESNQGRDVLSSDQRQHDKRMSPSRYGNSRSYASNHQGHQKYNNHYTQNYSGRRNRPEGSWRSNDMQMRDNRLPREEKSHNTATHVKHRGRRSESGPSIERLEWLN